MMGNLADVAAYLYNEWGFAVLYQPFILVNPPRERPS